MFEKKLDENTVKPDNSSKLISPFVINWMALRIAIIDGAEKYLQGEYSSGDRYGIFHGELGRNRALWVKRVANIINDFDTTIATALTIYGQPTTGYFFDWEMRRSSALASCIADLCITGDREFYSSGGSIDTLDSHVFNLNFVKATAEEYQQKRVASSGDGDAVMYFDKTKGCREVFSATLLNLPHERGNNIKNKVLHLKNIFENTACKGKTDAEIIDQVIKNRI